MKKNKVLHFRVLGIISFVLFVVSFMSSCNEEGAQFREFTYPVPTVAGISHNVGFPTQEITITGTNFGDAKGAVKLYFNDLLTDVADIVSIIDTKIVVKVPLAAKSGNIKMSVWTNDLGIIGTFQVLPLPVINSIISTGVAPVIAQTGDVVKISGINFPLTNVAVDFNGTPATNIISSTSSLITVVAPAGYTAGNVSLTFNDVFKLTGSALTPVVPTGDVSQYFLKNYKQPLYTAEGVLSTDFTTAQKNARWYTPRDWNVTSNIKNHNNSLLGSLQGGLDYRGTNSNNGLIFGIESGWGAPAIINGQLWQTVTLPAGNYTLETDMRENGNTWSNVFFCAAEGVAIPTTVNATTTVGFKSISMNKHDNGTNDNIHDVVSFSFSLATTKQISYGIVIPSFTGTSSTGNFVRFQYFKLTRN